MPTSPGSAFENSLALLSQQLQVDWDAVIQRASENGSVLGDRGVASHYALWTALEQVYEKSDFPFAVAQLSARTPSNFAQLACICSPNLKSALSRLESARAVLNAVKLSVIESPDEMRVSVASSNPTASMPESMQVALLSYCVAVTRMSANKNFKPLGFNLPESARARTEAAAYFGVEPGMGDVELKIRSEDALATFRTNHEEIWSLFEQRHNAAAKASMPDSEHVQEVLYALLPSGFSTVDHVASKLAVSKRTLQRKLSAEGETYQRLLHKTRQQLAHYYLSLADVSVNEIAGMLGYRDPHSFLRAYRGWTGERPVKVESS